MMDMAVNAGYFRFWFPQSCICTFPTTWTAVKESVLNVYTRHVFKVRSGEPLKITHKR